MANAPEDFDTLKEISDWIESHEDSAAAMNSSILANTTAITTKVDKVSGKGLSANDFTNEAKSKLDNLENYDDTDVRVDVAELASQAAINKSTLGYQRKNLFNFYSWVSSLKPTPWHGTQKIFENSITLTATDNGCYTNPFFVDSSAGQPYKQPVRPSTSYVLSWVTESDNQGRAIVFKNGTIALKIEANTTDTNQIVFTTDTNTSFITLRFDVINSGDSITYSNIMLRYADITDDTYEPYKPSVAEYIANLEARINALELTNQEEKSND